MLKSLLRHFFLTVLITLIAVSTVIAQQNRASLKGLVADEMGAAIVGASVTLTDSTGQAKNTVSANDGTYTFAGLVPGKYVVRASAKGFAPTTGDEIEIKAGQRA